MSEKNNPIKLKVLDYSAKKVGEVSLDNLLFRVEPNEVVVQRAVKVYLANRRQATAKTKGISEVSGSGKKPWRQKGTGRARAGSTRSPIWVGGATIFGPSGNQNYKLKMNKSEHLLALASVLSDKANNNAIKVVQDGNFISPKTKDFVKALADLKLADKKVLFVIDGCDENFARACTNIQNLTVVFVTNVSVYDVLNADQLVFTKGALDILDEKFGDDLIAVEDVKEAK